jgi:Tol biopolymer transport system component
MNKSTLCITSLVGAIVLVSAFTASTRAQRYSDWSEPINLGPTVNSTAMDRAPAISKDGLSLYFASNRLGFGGEDIYVSQRDTRDDEWGPAMNLGPAINSTDNEMVPALSRDGHLLFFASSRLGGFGGVDIWVSRREQTHDDFGWQQPENLGAGVNSAAIDEGPSYFENDEVGVPQLYFSSGMNRPGGAGIYVSEQAADGSFGPAVRVIVSVANVRPSIRHDGLEIFFTSNRPGSIANSQDLWVATRETVFDAWSEPINLGSPLNSELVDVQAYISSDGETLFFASNRPSGGPTDIYMSTRTKR